MNDSVSYVRLTIVAIVAIAIWFLSTFVPSPYTRDTALAPSGVVHEASRPEPLGDAQVPAVPQEQVRFGATHLISAGHSG